MSNIESVHLRLVQIGMNLKKACGDINELPPQDYRDLPHSLIVYADYIVKLTLMKDLSFLIYGMEHTDDWQQELSQQIQDLEKELTFVKGGRP